MKSAGGKVENEDASQSHAPADGRARSCPANGDEGPGHVVKKNRPIPPAATGRRQRAEQRVKKTPAAAHRNADAQRALPGAEAPRSEWEPPNEERPMSRQEPEHKYRRLYHSMMDGFVSVDMTGRILETNAAYRQMVGYTEGELRQMTYVDLTPEKWHAVEAKIVEEQILRRGHSEIYAKEYRRKDGTVFPVELRTSLQRDADGRAVAMWAIVRDTTERNRLTDERTLITQVFERIAESGSRDELMRSTAALLQSGSGCEAIGIRLREGDDFPYFETRGFAAAFVRLESRLCATDDQGRTLRDEQGNPVLECMCGNVLGGRFDPAKDFFTARGTFWTNSTTQLLASTTAADRQARTRNRCHGAGYESVALIRMRVGGETLGLLQFNDPRPGRFTPEKIGLLERVADHLAVALARWQADETWRKSEADLAHAQTLAHVGNWSWDLRQEKLKWSDETYRIFGVGPETCRPTWAALAQLIHPEDRPRQWQVVDQIQAEKPIEPYELRVVRPDGGIRTVQVVCAAIERDAAGQPSRVFGSVQDISERKRIETGLRQLSQATEQSPASVMITDPSGGIEYVNPKFTQLTGYTLAEVQGRNPRFLKSGETPPEVYRQLWATITAGGEWRGQLHNRKKNGDLYWEYVLISPIKEADGRITHYLSVKEDITDRLRVTQELADNRDQLRSLRARAAEAEEMEWRRLARELHDQVGQSLTALGLNLNYLKSQMPATAVALPARIDDSLALVA